MHDCQRTRAPRQQPTLLAKIYATSVLLVRTRRNRSASAHWRIASHARASRRLPNCRATDSSHHPMDYNNNNVNTHPGPTHDAKTLPVQNKRVCLRQLCRGERLRNDTRRCDQIELRWRTIKVMNKLAATKKKPPPKAALPRRQSRSNHRSHSSNRAAHIFALVLAVSFAAAASHIASAYASLQREIAAADAPR